MFISFVKPNLKSFSDAVVLILSGSELQIFATMPSSRVFDAYEQLYNISEKTVASTEVKGHN